MSRVTVAYIGNGTIATDFYLRTQHKERRGVYWG